MRLPSVSDVVGAATLARRAAETAPGVAVRLLADDRAVAVVRRATGSAGLRRAVGGRRVLLVGTDAAAAELRRAGATVDVVAPGDAPDAVGGEPPEVLVLCAVPVADGRDSTDMDAAIEAIEATYYASVRAVLAVLPEMRARRSGQIIAASASAPDASPADRAAAEAQRAFLRIVSAEVAGDGVVVTRVNLPSDPERAARRICEAVALRPRQAPVRLSLPL
jgi:hypothetical protein